MNESILRIDSPTQFVEQVGTEVKTIEYMLLDEFTMVVPEWVTTVIIANAEVIGGEFKVGCKSLRAPKAVKITTQLPTSLEILDLGSYPVVDKWDLPNLKILKMPLATSLAYAEVLKEVMPSLRKVYLDELTDMMPYVNVVCETLFVPKVKSYDAGFHIDNLKELVVDSLPDVDINNYPLLVTLSAVSATYVKGIPGYLRTMHVNKATTIEVYDPKLSVTRIIL